MFKHDTLVMQKLPARIIPTDWTVLQGFVCDRQYLEMNPVADRQWSDRRMEAIFMYCLAPDNSCDILPKLEAHSQHLVLVFKHLGISF